MQELAHMVLLDRSLNSTALIQITNSAADLFAAHPKTLARLEQLLGVLQPEPEADSSKGLEEVKEWLKQFLVRQDLTDALG